MLDTQLGEVQVEVRANLDKLVADFARGKAQAVAFEKDMNRVTRSTELTAAAEQKLHNELISLARAYDPVHAAALRYQTDLQRIRALERAAIVDQVGAARLRAGATAAYNQASQGIAAVGNSARGAGLLVKGFVGIIGVSLVQALMSSAASALQTTAAIGDFAKQVGLTTDEVQEYRGIAKDLNLTQDELDRGFRQFSETVSDAAAGLERPERLFKLLGISIKDAEGKTRPLNDLFLETIDRLGQVGNEAERRAGQMVAFGDDVGSKMGTAVEMGSAKINELRAAVSDTGIVLSEEQIQNADQTAKKLEQVKLVLTAKIAGVVADNAEAIGKLADVLATLAGAAVQAMGSVPGFFNWLSSSIPESTAKALEAIPVFGQLIGLMNAWKALSGGGAGDVRGFNTPGRSVTVSLGAAKPVAKPGTGGNISLAGLLDREKKGRKGREVENQFAREELRAREQNLRLLRERSGNLEEINRIDHQLIDINLDERKVQIDQQLKRKALTAAQAASLKQQEEANAALEHEAADRKMREALIEESYRSAEEGLRLEDEALGYMLRMARTDEERRRVELLLLDIKQQQARSEIEKAIALAKEANDEARVAELTEQRRKLIENQRSEIQAFTVEHLRGIEKFRNDLPRTAKEINAAIESIRFDMFTQKLEEATQFAEDLGGAFGRAAGDIARFRNPVEVLKNLVGDLAETFTRNFIEKPVTEWATRNLGMPVAGKLFGDDLTGPDALTVEQMNVALGIATQNLSVLAQAALAASNAMTNTTVTGLGPLTTETAATTSAMQAQQPALNQFGSGLMSILGSLAGGGGGSGGFFASLLQIGASVAGSVGGAGSIPRPNFNAAQPLSFLSSGSVPLVPGFAGGGFTGYGRRGGIAGFVHSNEFVFDAPTTQRLRPLFEAIHAGRLPTMMPADPRGRGGGGLTANLGGVHIHGAKDDRSARRAGKQALAEMQRGLGRVSRSGMVR